MKWSSHVSEKKTAWEAVSECAYEINRQLAGEIPDLAIVFVSKHFADEYGIIPSMVRDRLNGASLIGCSADGVIGGGHEVEGRPALAITAGFLPEVSVRTFHLRDRDLPDMDAPPSAWEELIGVEAVKEPQFVILADPFSFHAENFLLGMDYAYPNSVKIGGLASGGADAGSNAIYLGNDALSSGLVGVALSGNIMIDTVVAQGCRPVGRPMTITRCQSNTVLEMDGLPPLQVLQNIFESLNESDKKLLQHSLFLGVGMDELRDEHRHGDFLIRNLLGMDAKHGAISVGAYLREGQTVQFHLRDAQTSAEDLDLLLGQYAGQEECLPGEGAVLFSCLGRGYDLYGRADHDTNMFMSKVGAMPLGGFFCNGEIGPVGSTTYLHGYTSSFGIFRPAR
ncbi:MAG: hypothetical protein EXR50_05880 [Dehalococcoidia bacterium]|nr:hypothetical protein [Dehalococcoidia bacterium]